MPTIIEYLDAAQARQKITSDSKLSTLLGVSQPVCSEIRRGRNLPSDDLMMRLAELAGADPERALLDLNLARAKSARVSETYSKIIQRLGAASLALALWIAGAPAASARTHAEQADMSARSSIYYQKSRYRRLWSILRTFAKPPIFLMTT